MRLSRLHPSLPKRTARLDLVLAIALISQVTAHAAGIGLFESAADIGKIDLHRKACAMVRHSLDADSPYVDVAVHGDGLVNYRHVLP